MHHKVSATAWVSILVLIAFIAGYLIWAEENKAWPFDDQIIPYPEGRQNR